MTSRGGAAMGRYEQIDATAKSAPTDCAAALMKSAYVGDCKTFKKPDHGTRTPGQSTPGQSTFQFDGLEGLNGSTREIPRYASKAAAEIPKFLCQAWGETCHSFKEMPAEQKAGWVALGLITVGIAVASRGRVNTAALQQETLVGEQLVSRTITVVRTGFNRGVHESYKLANGSSQSFWLDAESANGRKAIAELMRIRKN
jgi:hypothetical protein